MNFILMVIVAYAIMFDISLCLLPCGSDEKLARDLRRPGRRKSMDSINKHWLKNKNNRHFHGYKRQQTPDFPNPIVIPVNFHILNFSLDNLEPATPPFQPFIGYHQIISQLSRLNKDFMLLNNDVTSGEFKDDVGNFRIRFSLNRIARVKEIEWYTYYGVDNWEPMKFSVSGGSDSIDPHHMLNIWVTEISACCLGIATFPGGQWETDGMVVDFNVFGDKKYDYTNSWSRSLMTKADLGRTVTHEIGHWLNLNHIFNYNTCLDDDYVNDTRISKTSHKGYPQVAESSCNSTDMFMNYMDYVNDSCMNMFTRGQVAKSYDLFTDGGWRHELIDYYYNPTDITFVDYFYFIIYEDGDDHDRSRDDIQSRCNVDHVLINTNLNQGAGGIYSIYLCVSYSKNPYVDVISDIYLVSDSDSYSCSVDYVQIDTNLNHGTDADDIYVCYKKESRLNTNQYVVDINIFRNLNTKKGGFNLLSTNLNEYGYGNGLYFGVKKYFADKSMIGYNDVTHVSNWLNDKYILYDAFLISLLIIFNSIFICYYCVWADSKVNKSYNKV